MNLEEILDPHFRRLERETDIELYEKLRVLKDDQKAKFPWYLPILKDSFEAELQKLDSSIRVFLCKGLSSNFMLVRHTSKNLYYVANLAALDNDDELGVPIERKVTNVPRTNKHGEKNQAARMVIEGFTLERIGCGIGDICDLYTVDSTEDRIGYLKIVPRKRLKG